MTHRYFTTAVSAAAFAFLAAPHHPATAAELPQIRVSETNKVPACVTPGRLMSYIRSRNEKLAPKFDNLATEYMRNGEEFGIRWDYAFFQMMLETNTLKYTGDVKISQNNFAGLGATGRGARGESFATVADGVRAHLQHVLMYSGETIDNPVAKRTRDIQDWGVLTKWQKTINEPMTYTHLAKQWAPTSRGYPKDVDVLAGLFFDGACKDTDPNPEMIQEARKGRGVETDGTVGTAGKGAEIAKQAVAEARSQGVQKSALGAEDIAKSTYDATAASVASGPPVKLLNASTEDPTTETSQPATEKPATPPADSAPTKIETAALNVPPADKAKPASSPNCRVFTASYGGGKSVIIKALADGVTNYTVLDINDGSEKRETEAYIGAYAKGGQTIGDPQAQDKALEKAFELCPEG